MHNPEILPSPPLPPSAPTPWMFDACQLGVVLRAVLAVQLLLGLIAAYTSTGWLDWLLQTAWLTSGGLSGTLAWLVLTCASKRLLQRCPPWLQYATGVALGALCGAYACAVLHFGGPLSAVHWLPNTVLGGVLASMLMGWMLLRARARTPAATLAQLALLQARIRPHFLFNALNSAIALVRADPALAEQLLQDLSDLFRAALHEQRSTISLGEEVELAQRYLDIEQIRFGARMQVRWEIDPSALHLPVPPLLLQPLAENAVKHGIEPSESGGLIRISARRHGRSDALITVTNTVAQRRAGMPPASAGLGMALANVRHRLHLLYDMDCHMQLRQKSHAFQVRLRLPLPPPPHQPRQRSET